MTQPRRTVRRRGALGEHDSGRPPPVDQGLAAAVGALVQHVYGQQAAEGRAAAGGASTPNLRTLRQVSMHLGGLLTLRDDHPLGMLVDPNPEKAGQTAERWAAVRDLSIVMVQLYKNQADASSSAA